MGAARGVRLSARAAIRATARAALHAVAGTRPHPARAARRGLVASALALLALTGSAHAVEPGFRHAQSPTDLGLVADTVSFLSADSSQVTGWWFDGPKDAPVIVVAPRGSGTMADLLPAVKEWLGRGFGALTFDYRGFGPASSEAARDSLRHVFLSSRWVDEMLGALRYARARGGRHVFAWGQDVGSAVALAGAARERQSCDAVAVEGVFRTSQEFLRLNGTATMNDVVVWHRRNVRGEDEPLSAAARLQVPLFIVLAGRDSVTSVAISRQVAARAPIRSDTWVIPDAGHAGAETTPGYYDRLAAWFKQWTAFPPGGQP
jgi:alpha-beta hydrolase superfamily lysophospholipase